jgi:MauM/NapG family ferredoxin protein
LKPKTIRSLKNLTQIFSFALFLFLFVQAVYLGRSLLASDLFYRVDPLIAATAMLAGRAIKAGLLYAILNLLAALVFGRVWCGWFCPFGTLLEWISPNHQLKKTLPADWRTIKYLLLLVLIIAAILANQTLAFLDPISILTRSMTAAIWPALRFLVYGLESFLYKFDVLWPMLDNLNSNMLLPLFQGIESVFIASLPIFLMFMIILSLNWIAERFWCRYLCPLGGLLGLTSRFSIFRRQVDNTCTACGLCARICPTGTIDPAKAYASDPAECIVCYDCVVKCPVGAVSFPARISEWKAAASQPYDPDKRQTLLTMAGTLGGIALAGIEPVNRRQPERVIRPPGARLTDFTSVCMRCGECVRVCPTQGLQPSLLEGGWQNIFTPHLVPRLGYCSYTCSACIETCPTGAIPPLTLEEKQTTSIGLASINRDRCLPWAYNTICSVCEEMCPLAEKAITLVEEEFSYSNGDTAFIKKPVVNRELCIGCGICEYHCPAGGEAAIQVQTLPDLDTYIQGI